MNLLRGLRREHYACILADPGTEFEARSAKGITSRSPQAKYTTMPLSEIAALPVERYAAEDSLLWFWTTTPLLAKGAHIPIMKAWGFRPTAFAFVWVKTLKSEDPSLFLYSDSFHFGSGYTTRKNVEVCILGRRGSPKRLSARVRELLIAPRREHSRKPDEVYDRIEEYCAGPRLELFGRTRRKGWTQRGDQLGVFG